MLDTFTLETFTALPSGEFGLTDDSNGTSMKIELIEARSSGAAAAGMSRDPFSLMFNGPREPLLAQGTYRLSHPALGEFELFIVPIGQDADGTRYEAVFA
jgi:hypothetical protein